jgi:hypothetical protein
MKIVNIKYNESIHIFTDKNYYVLDYESVIYKFLSILHYWRSIYRKFRAEIKFITCISDHFFKIDYVSDPSYIFYYNFSNNNFKISSQHSEKYIYQKDFAKSIKNEYNSNYNFKNVNNKYLNKTIKDTNIALKNNTDHLKDTSETVFNFNKKNLIIGHLINSRFISNITEAFFINISNLINLKRWIDDLIDLFGVFECTKTYMWALLLRWLNL